ncbi:DNA methyltransferase [Oscillatoria sp. FACHB-1406]|uniref:DNA methyltransferase n=1 Tax=Oscillatoria sp. FACHB-1406 TaxID=2692846 RepID=UPI001688A927|nr:DNA methyltransferase [Oscillatoria sp. FACHB-1406]MBD2577956.1 DNA modification methylase [Oscillatoria sp. FACHB-1406]
MTQFSQLSLFSTNSDLYETSHSQIVSERAGTFTDNMKLPVHRWFRYSAGFSAIWVENAIAELKPETILDPFAGSGTVCIAADRLGINSFGIEAHPFVYKLAQGKLAWETDIQEFLDAVAELKSMALKLKLDLPPNTSTLLRKCYLDKILIDLFKIKQSYFELAPLLSDPLQSLVFLTISAILRSSSHVGTAQWQYILPNKQKTRFLEPFEALEKQAQIMGQDLKFFQSIAPSSRAILIREDARSLKSIPDRAVDLVISSPPYANNYDYADATRLEMTFWGEVNTWGDLHEAARKFLIRSSSQHASKERLKLDDLINSSIVEPIRDEMIPVCQALEQVRGTKGGNKAYHTMIAAYFNDLGLVFQSLRRVTVPKGKICFVIGDSAPYGIYVPVEQWIGKLAIASGFKSWEFEQIRQRNIKWKNRKHNVPLQEGRLWIEG